MNPLEPIPSETTKQKPAYYFNYTTSPTPTETIDRGGNNQLAKPNDDSYGDNATTTVSSTQSSTQLPQTLKPIPVESIKAFQKQQKQRTRIGKLFCCFQGEEGEQTTKPPRKKPNIAKPPQVIILPQTGKPPKGIAPWQRTRTKSQSNQQLAKSVSENTNNTENTMENKENESSRSGIGAPSSSSAAPWRSGLRSQSKTTTTTTDSQTFFTIPEELATTAPTHS
eukprot:jgi/Galph1/2018/GphlegSOOS_G694.1